MGNFWDGFIFQTTLPKTKTALKLFFIYLIVLFIDCFDVACDELLINYEAAFHLFMEVLKCTVHTHYVQISA